MTTRIHSPYYVSRKNMQKYGIDKIIPRFKVNESYSYYLRYQTLPYNEVLIKTSAMEPGQNPVADISHIVLVQENQDISIHSLLAAISSQMEFMLHLESNRYVPICYYDVTPALIPQYPPVAWLF